MALNIGYNPQQYSPNGAGVQSLEQWAAAQASQYTVAFANGNTDAFPANAFSNDFWATLGLPPLPSESWGATAANPNNTINPGVYSGLHMFFTQLATNPQSAATAGITVPQLPSMGPVTDDLGRTHLYGAAQNEANNANQLAIVNAQNSGAMARDAANNAFTAGENAASRAQQLAIANLQEGGMNSRSAAEIAARMSIAQLQEAGESSRNAARIAADLSMNATNNETQRAIANLQEAGMSARQAQELASRMSIAQLQEAGESARNAQRIAADISMNEKNNETQRYGIDTNAAVSREDMAGRERMATADRTSRETISEKDRAESARQFDMNLGEDRRQFNATMLFEMFGMGVELMKNPVDWLAYQHYLENLNIPLGAINYAATASELGAVPPSGPSELGPMTGGPAVLDGDFAAAQAAGVSPGFVALGQALQQNPGNAQNPVTASAAFSNTVQAYDIASAEQMVNQSRAATLPGVTDPSNPILAQASQMNAAAGSPVATTNTAGTAGNMTQSLTPIPGSSQNGIYSGDQTAQQYPSSGSTAPMEQLIKQLSGQMGVSEQELWRMSGAGNMTPAYSKDQIANSPVIQALKNGADSMSQFHTGSAFGTASPTAASTGPGLGLRGGQDMNAQLLINNAEGTKGLIQGAVMADGHDWNTFAKQSLKASPISDYEVGAFGRRR